MGAADLCATDEDADHQLHDMDAILVPGGFGIRGLDGKSRRIEICS